MTATLTLNPPITTHRHRGKRHVPINRVPKDYALWRISVAQYHAVNYLIRAQEPITLAESGPEPDLAVVQGTIRQYQNRHPSAQEVEMLVEVADATLGRDCSSKKRIYAQAGIPIYWIVNLLDKQVECYTYPYQDENKSDYREKRYSI